MATGKWRDEWEVVDPLSSGGHGYTHKVRRRHSTDGALYVLKTLKDQRSPERRARLYAEAAALKTLDHPRVARLVESNSEAYADLNVPLHLVTEFIDGPPMSGLPVPVPVEDACACLDAILEALAFCHERGSLHRDLKPDNVILRGGAVRDPVLIDFGQTFNADAPIAGFETETGQHLGNRFMHLPELMTTGADKRNQLSDISFCVGLLFFLLTGRHPEALRDHQQRRPDERDAARQQLAQLPEQQRQQLNRIFTIGFSTDFERRWQSIGELRSALANVAHPDPGGKRMPFAERVRLIKQSMIEDPEHAVRSQLAQIHSAMSGLVHKSFDLLKLELQPTIQATFNNDAFDVSRGRCMFDFNFNHTQYGKHTHLIFVWQRIAGQLVIYGNVDVQQNLFHATKFEEGTELARVNLSDPDITETLHATFESFVTEQLARWLERLSQPT